MDLYYGMIVLGLASLSAPFLAKLAGYEMHRKPFDFVGVSGIFFLLAASFSLASTLITGIASIGHMLIIGSFTLGLVGLLVGALWGAGEVFRESNHGLLGSKG